MRLVFAFGMSFLLGTTFASAGPREIAVAALATDLPKCAEQVGYSAIELYDFVPHRTAYLVDYATIFNCEDARYFCGSAGCVVKIVTVDGSRANTIFEQNVQAIAGYGYAGKSAIAMFIASKGDECDATAIGSCHFAVFWKDGKLARKLVSRSVPK